MVRLPVRQDLVVGVSGAGVGQAGSKTHFSPKVTLQVIFLCVSPSEPRGTLAPDRTISPSWGGSDF